MSAKFKYTDEALQYGGRAFGAKLACEYGCLEQLERDADGNLIAPEYMKCGLLDGKKEAFRKFALRGITDHGQQDHLYRKIEQYALKYIDDIYNGRLPNTGLMNGFPVAN